MAYQLDELTERIKNWTVDEDIGSMVSDFVDLVNADLNARLRTRHNTKSIEQTLVSNSNLHPLPNDFIGAKNVSLNGEDLSYLTLEQMNQNMSHMNSHSYAIVGDQIKIHPIPDDIEQTVIQDPWISLIIAYDKYGDIPGSGSWYPYIAQSTILTPDEFTGSLFLRVSRYEVAAPTNPPTVSDHKMTKLGDSFTFNYNASASMDDYFWTFEAWFNTIDGNRIVSDTIKLDATGEDRDVFVLTNEGGGQVETDILSMPPLNLVYFHELPALSDGNSVTTPSAFYSSFPNIYLYGCLAEAFKYLYDAPRAETWKARYEEDVEKLIQNDQRDVFSGSTLTIRAI